MRSLLQANNCQSQEFLIEKLSCLIRQWWYYLSIYPAFGHSFYLTSASRLPSHFCPPLSPPPKGGGKGKGKGKGKQSIDKGGVKQGFATPIQLIDKGWLASLKKKKSLLPSLDMLSMATPSLLFFYHLLRSLKGSLFFKGASPQKDLSSSILSAQPIFVKGVFMGLLTYLKIGAKPLLKKKLSPSFTPPDSPPLGGGKEVKGKSRKNKIMPSILALAPIQSLNKGLIADPSIANMVVLSERLRVPLPLLALLFTNSPNTSYNSIGGNRVRLRGKFCRVWGVAPTKRLQKKIQLLASNCNYNKKQPGLLLAKLINSPAPPYHYVGNGCFAIYRNREVDKGRTALLNLFIIAWEEEVRYAKHRQGERCFFIAGPSFFKRGFLGPSPFKKKRAPQSPFFFYGNEGAFIYRTLFPNFPLALLTPLGLAALRAAPLYNKKALLGQSPINTNTNTLSTVSTSYLSRRLTAHIPLASIQRINKGLIIINTLAPIQRIDKGLMGQSPFTLFTRFFMCCFTFPPLPTSSPPLSIRCIGLLRFPFPPPKGGGTEGGKRRESNALIRGGGKWERGESVLSSPLSIRCIGAYGALPYSPSLPPFGSPPSHFLPPLTPLKGGKRGGRKWEGGEMKREEGGKGGKEVNKNSRKIDGEGGTAKSLRVVKGYNQIPNHCKKVLKPAFFFMAKPYLDSFKKKRDAFYDFLKAKQNYSDAIIFKMLWKWVYRKHSNKSNTWIIKEYFYKINGRNWVFAIKKKVNYWDYDGAIAKKLNSTDITTLVTNQNTIMAKPYPTYPPLRLASLKGRGRGGDFKKLSLKKMLHIKASLKQKLCFFQLLSLNFFVNFVFVKKLSNSLLTVTGKQKHFLGGNPLTKKNYQMAAKAKLLIQLPIYSFINSKHVVNYLIMALCGEAPFKKRGPWITEKKKFMQSIITIPTHREISITHQKKIKKKDSYYDSNQLYWSYRKSKLEAPTRF